MIKIRPTGIKGEKARSGKGREASSVGKTGKAFSAQLVQTVSHEFQDTIVGMLEDLADQEKKFLDSQSLYEMSRYKSLVQKILGEISRQGFTVKTMKPTRRYGLEMRIVEDINRRLMEIKEAVTTSNKAFDLMKSIEEIRGLILDLVY